MNKTIWKYELKVSDTQELMIPEGFRPICVQTQGGLPCMWVEVNPENKDIPVTVYVVGTGHPLPSASYYVGTFQIYDGELVFHVYL